MSLSHDFQYVGVGLCQAEAGIINGFLNQYVNSYTQQERHQKLTEIPYDLSLQ